jgi:uncharacterized protein YggE
MSRHPFLLSRHSPLRTPALAATVAIVVVAAVALTALLGATPAGAAGRRRTITVVGVGQVQGRPDVADLSIGVTARAGSAVNALSTTGDRAQKVLGVLHDAGVDDADIRTTDLSLNPTYDEGGGINGYEATNTVIARIRDLAKAGAVIDAAAGVAGDNIRVQGISFSIDDDSKLLASARSKAVKRARAQAEQLAEAAGVSAGDVLSIDEQTASVPIDSRALDGAAAGATPVSPGTQTLTVSATVVYAIA